MSTLSTRGAWRVPGRIEFLGKHTDYAGGNVLVGAVDRGVSAVAKQVDGAAGFLSATTTAGGDPVRLQAGVDHGLPAGHWGRYLQTVLDRLTANFGPSVPAHLTITSDLPPASGMSSSSALICASALALADLNGWSTTELWKRNIPDRLSLAGYLAGVEAGRPWRELLGAEGVGTQGGSCWPASPPWRSASASPSPRTGPSSSASAACWQRRRVRPWLTTTVARSRCARS